MTAPLVVGLDLADRCVVVVGGGAVATRKVRSLVQAGAVVHVVSPDATRELAAAAEEGRLVWHARAYTPGDLDGAMLAVAATADAAVNAAVAADAERAGTWWARTDAPGAVTFTATVERGPLQLAVSTGGAGPALAAHLAGELRATYGPEWGELAELLGELRADPAVAAALDECDDAERARRWRSVVAADTLAHLRTGDRVRAREVAVSCLFSPSG